MIKPIRACDICDQQICDNGNSNGMIIHSDNFQLWPTKNGEKDICHSCCIVLDGAANLGIVEIDETPLYIQAGFKKEGDLWKAPYFVYGGRL